MNLWFATGLTGFIGSHLTHQILRDNPEVELVALVVPQDLPRIRQLRSSLLPTERQRFRYVIGDITQPDLGLADEDLRLLQRDVREIFHLAAFYRLDVSAETAWRVNYLGTRAVVDFALSCKSLAAFHHFSSLVADGMRSVDWDSPGQLIHRPFLNDYERSKYLSEVFVRESLGNRVPSLNIFRPGIVIGDSQSGATPKFDGFYFCLLLIWRFRWLLRFMPLGLSVNDVHLPIVPVDYVAKVAAHIARQRLPGVHVFPIVDPQRIDWRQTVVTAYKKIVGMPPRFFLGSGTLAWLFRLPVLRRWLGFPPVTFAYVDYEIPADLTETHNALEGSGITPPSSERYLPAVLEYFLHNVKQRRNFQPPEEPRSYTPAAPRRTEEQQWIFPFQEPAGDAYRISSGLALR